MTDNIEDALIKRNLVTPERLDEARQDSTPVTAFARWARRLEVPVSVSIEAPHQTEATAPSGPAASSIPHIPSSSSPSANQFDHWILGLRKTSVEKKSDACANLREFH